MDSLTWLLNKLDMTYDELLSLRRDFTPKRWVMMWFYRKMGKSYPFIAKVLGKNHVSCRHGCNNASDTIKALAEKLLFEYITEVLHEEPHFERFKPRETVDIKVPNYHTNTTEIKTVFKDELKPIKKIRRWDL